jgi:uncharacterized protein YkwD
MNMKRIPAAGLLETIIILVLCAVPVAESRENASRGSKTPMTALSQAPKPDIDISRLEKRIHDLINQERKKKGLSVLSRSEGLNRCARRYSNDMAERNFFSHNDPEGRSFIDRFKEEGFECKITVGNATCLGAENIAQDNLYASAVVMDGKMIYKWNTEEEIALSVVKRWMASKGHRENVLTPYFRRQGVGIAISGGRVYVTGNFC